MILSAALLIKLLVGYERSKNRYYKDSLMNIFIIVMLYYISIYIIGIFIGFLRTGYSTTLLGITRNSFPVLLMIVTVEILRYMLSTKVKESKKTLLLITITFILLEIMFSTQLFNIASGKDIVGIIALIIFPAISKNILLGYTTLAFGFVPAIFYRILMEIPEYFLPIFPNFNEYINAILLFLMPLIILYFLAKTIKKNNKDGKKESSLNKKIIDKVITSSLVLLMVFIIALTSGMFKYFAISIGSGSMSPNINVGDVAIVKKVDNVDDIEIGDVLVYNHDNVVVVHRVEEKYEEDNVIKIKTKGDNNKDIDNWVVTEDKIIGIVSLKISYLGHPTVWLSKQLK